MLGAAYHSWQYAPEAFGASCFCLFCLYWVLVGMMSR